MSDSKKVFKTIPTHRLVDHPLPLLSILDSLNPDLPFLTQNPGMGWNNPCVPSRAGRKVNEFVDGQGKYNLLQDIAHAKKWIMEQVGDMITCYLPTWIRKPKLVIRVIKLGRYIRQLVATYLFWRSVVEREVAFANHYIEQCNMIIDYGKQTLSPAHLRAEWENELEKVFDQAILDNIRQAQENEQSKCLI